MTDTDIRPSTRFRWFQNNTLTHHLYWCGMYAGAALSDYPKDTWRAWVQDCEDCSLVGVYPNLADARLALMAKVMEIVDASG